MQRVVDTIYRGGEAISLARTPQDFREALADLRTIVDPDVVEHVAAEHERSETVLTETPFNRGIARDDAIRLGTLPVLYAMPSDDKTSALLRTYVQGIRDGGFSFWEARPLVGIRIAQEVTALLSESSYVAYHRACWLEHQAAEAGVLSVRDLMMTSGAHLRHTWRHRAPRNLQRWAKSHAGKTHVLANREPTE